ncbi:DsbA family oxidoreductase [Thalassotalea maritima]|uniref:DsbA family oxidoreductase n=1 Tax=Thalassotalea maritima TaxID=3242416 RepID=UPI003527C724
MSSKALKIDIISDVVCPWCVIGYGRLKRALTDFGDDLNVNIQWHPFELNPNMPDYGENLREHLAKKYGTSKEDSIRARAMLTEEGKKIGFQFNFFDEMRIFNTHDCHQLLLCTESSDLQTELAEALFRHYFSDQGTFELASLVKIANEADLAANEARQLLEEQTLSAQVREIEKNWHHQGINAVPLFVFNNSHALSGAQEVDTFKNLIASIIKKAP